MNLEILEDRILHEMEFYPADIPKRQAKEIIREEFARFNSEIERMSPKEDKVGQASLTKHEIQQMKPLGNQNNDRLTLIELQCIKAHAIKYGVQDWIPIVDEDLTYEENIELMKSEGTKSTEELRYVESPI